MKQVVLDTHIWLWYLNGDCQLSKKAIDVIEDSKTQCLLSSISVWELSILLKKKKVKLNLDLSAWLRKANQVLPIKEAPLTSTIAINSSELEFKHEDPADRFIAATAYAYKASLISADKKLKKLKWLEVIS